MKTICNTAILLFGLLDFLSCATAGVVCEDLKTMGELLHGTANQVSVANTDLMSMSKLSSQNESDAPRTMMISYEADAVIREVIPHAAFIQMQNEMKVEADRKVVGKYQNRFFLQGVPVLNQRISNINGYIPGIKNMALIQQAMKVRDSVQAVLDAFKACAK